MATGSVDFLTILLQTHRHGSWRRLGWKPQILKDSPRYLDEWSQTCTELETVSFSSSQTRTDTHAHSLTFTHAHTETHKYTHADTHTWIERRNTYTRIYRNAYTHRRNNILHKNTGNIRSPLN